ncbi:hypothetical protein DV738_g3239, partial [Chaetothyriales sp. CBS 135597]
MYSTSGGHDAEKSVVSSSVSNTNNNMGSDTEKVAAESELRNENRRRTSVEVLELKDIDPALDEKMYLALDEMGWTNYHLKLFFLAGFGYAVDALQVSLQGIIAVQAVIEFQPSYDKGLTIALYLGMLIGALFWGLFADIIGRKIAFNISLFICSIFTIIAGASPTWESLGVFIALGAFGAGGNLILDTTVFLEYLPSNKQWLVSLLPCWFGVGCTIAGLVAWGFMHASDCTQANNSGWRYLMYSMGAFIFVLSVLRVTVIRLRETPKFLLGQGKDAEVVQLFQELAHRYHRPCSLTIEGLDACGTVSSAHSHSKFSMGEFLIHFRSLFLTRQVAITTALLWISWFIVGLAYPLFIVFLPYYLASRGIEFGAPSTYETWWNYALVQVSSIFGPIVGANMANCRLFKRRYTMIIGALITMAIFFGYSQVASQTGNIVYSCMISFALQIYYGVLYGYTSEVLPAAHRATGNGVAVAFCRLAGIMSAVVVTYASPSTTAPSCNRMASPPARGLLVVVEGLDRSGKSSQCQRLQENVVKAGHPAKYVKFPDRSTPTGQMINSYLTRQANQDDHSIHLLFAANRWEAVTSMLEDLRSGTTLVVDRYSFSGAVYSAAKENPDLSLDWAWNPEIGLPKPDIVFFLDISAGDAAKRGGYGDERYETEKLQSRVRTLFQQLFARLPGLRLYSVDAGGSVDEVAGTIFSHFQEAVASIDLASALQKLPSLA